MLHTMALSKRDKIILDMAGKGQSAREIAAETGFPEVKVALELDRLLSSMDWLSEMARLKLLLHSNYALKNELERRALEEGDAKSATDLIRLLRDMADLMDRISARADANIEKVETAHAKAMMKMIEDAFFSTLSSLKSRFPNLDEKQVEDDFRFNLQIVASEYDSRDDKIS